MDERTSRIDTAVEYLRRTSNGFQPLVGIILGSGLGKLGEKIDDAQVIPYGEIPGFPVSTTMGHKGNLIFGKLGGRNVVAMQGRIHYYECGDMGRVTFPVRVMARLGVKYLFVSNAAGGLNSSFEIGDLMVITDHINLLPNPLIGPNMEDFGPRFPDMTRPYAPELCAKAHEIASGEGYSLRDGVYCGVTGPTYETPAEVRFYTMVGGDAVGMSTVPEVIVARHCGIRVFGMSVITNKSNHSTEGATLNDGNDVIVMADKAADRMSGLFSRLITSL